MPRNARADAGTPAALLTCADVRAREWDFVEGVLPIPERAAVQAHLDGCIPCSQEITLVRSAEGALLSGTAQIPPAGDLRTGFYARLAAQQRPSRRYGRPAALSALAVGLLALALIRPQIHTAVVPPANPGRSSNTLAFVPPTRSDVPAVAPALPPHTTEEEAVRVPIVHGLSEEQAKRLFAAVERETLNSSRRRKGLHRSAPRRVATVRFPHSEPGLHVAVAALPELSRYGYKVADQNQSDNRSLAKDAADKPAVNAAFGEPGATGSAEQKAQYGMLQTASLQTDPTVHLVVTYQDGGTGNTTNVAGKADDGGPTFQIEAGGN